MFLSQLCPRHVSQELQRMPVLHSVLDARARAAEAASAAAQHSTLEASAQGSQGCFVPPVDQPARLAPAQLAAYLCFQYEVQPTP